MGANNIGTPWTETRDAQLRAAWAAGDTASKIAADMGGFDHTVDGGRNSVISRVHRLGLAKRAEGNPRLSPEERDRRLTARAKVKNDRAKARRHGVEYVACPVVAYVPPAPEPVYERQGIAFSELLDFKSSEPNQCRYIDAKDMGPNFLYCGSETLPGESYCGHCHEITRGKPHQISDMERVRRAAQQSKNLAPNLFKRPANFADGASV